MGRPMTAGVHIERCPRRIRAVFHGKTIADSRRASLVWRTGWPPVPWYYFPKDDVDSQFLAPTDHTDSHEAMGEARYWSVKVGDRVAENAAFGYPDSPVVELRDLRSLNFGQMDGWFEEDEEIFVHPRDPYHRIDVLYSSRHIEVSVDGVKVADSHRPRLLFETNMPTRYYLPKLDVRMDMLAASDTSSACPYKGVASYWSLTSGDVRAQDVAWGYGTPLVAASKVTGLVCFYNEKVDITVDGVAQKRPKTGFA